MARLDKWIFHLKVGSNFFDVELPNIMLASDIIIYGGSVPPFPQVNHRSPYSDYSIASVNIMLPIHDKF